MSSPSLRKHSTSPIRNLDDKSPRRQPKLHTIIQEDPYLPRYTNFTGVTLQRQNTSLNLQNRALNDKIRNYADQTTKFLIENSRLKQQNQVLRERSFSSNIVEVERLNRQVLLKDAEIDKLRSDTGLLKAHFDRNVDHMRLQNQGLRNQLRALQTQRYVQVEHIKQKYSAIAQQDMNLARKGYYDDIARLMSNLQATKALLAEKQYEIKHLTSHSQNLVRQHGAYLEQLISQNNILRNKILQIQIKKDNQVKSAQNRKELQKSRTQGIITFCKQNTAYIQKQVRQLAEELLQKNISIQQFTKDITKIKRNLQQTQKKYQQKLYKVENQCAQKIRQMETQIQKHDKLHKQELAQLLKKQMDLREQLSGKQNQLFLANKQIQHTKQIVQGKQKDIQALKANVSRMHEQHSKQISKVMSDSRVKRKSLRNLSEMSSSLKDLSVSGSGIMKKPIQRSNSITENQQNQSGQLYTVHQQMAASQLVHNQEQEDIAMKDLVLHYEKIIEQLKRNKMLQLSLAQQNIKKLQLKMKQKQQQLIQVLQKLSPLMQYKLSSKPIQVERKQKIQKHYKANIDLLSVLLNKYGIEALSRK